MAKRDIYEALADYEDAAAAAPAGTDLAAFVEAHPDQRGEIIDYAAYKFVFEHGAVYNPDCLTPESEERLLTRAQAMREIRRAASRVMAPAMTNLVDAAKQRELSVPVLAARLRLSPLEVTKLNQRLFVPESLPAALVRRLAEAIGQTREAVTVYLRLPPTLAAQASYKAEAAPRIVDQADFVEAVESSRALSPDDRAYWLGQAAMGKSDGED